MTINPSGADPFPRNANGQIEVPSSIIVAILNAIGGSISLDGYELNRIKPGTHVGVIQQQYPYRLILKVVEPDDK